jgi:hypothetical protein
VGRILYWTKPLDNGALYTAQGKWGGKEGQAEAAKWLVRTQLGGPGKKITGPQQCRGGSDCIASSAES